MKDKNGKQIHVYDKVRNNVGTIFEIIYMSDNLSDKARKWLATCELVEECTESDVLLRVGECTQIQEWLKEKIMENDIDFFGSKINVGDTVAFMKVGNRHLVAGIVIKKTNQMVKIEYTQEGWTGNQIHTQRYSQVIKKTKEETNE